MGGLAEERWDEVGAGHATPHVGAEQSSEPDDRSAVRDVQVAAMKDAPDLRVALGFDHEVKVDGRDMEEALARECAPEPGDRCCHVDGVDWDAGDIDPSGCPLRAT